MKYIIPELPVDSFDWLRWRTCDIWTKLKIPWRKTFIFNNCKDIRELVIGYLSGEQLLCRPKENTVAVMFLYNDEFSWCHMRKEEFDFIFGEKGEDNET